MSDQTSFYYGIPLEKPRTSKVQEGIPKDIAKNIIKQMKTLIGDSTDSSLGKLLNCGPAVVWQIENSATCRLKKSQIELFLEKRPDIPISKLLDGIAPPEFLVPTVIPEDASPQGEQPNPTGTSDEEKFKQLQSLGEDFAGTEKAPMPEEQRDRFIIALQKLSGNLNIHTISNYLGQEWVDFFLYSGIMPAIWLEKISILEDFKATSELFNLSSLETAYTISEEQQLEISKWKEATLKERENKGAISPVKRTSPKEPPPANYGAGKKPDGEQSAGNEKMVSILLNTAGVPLEISDAFFQGLLRAGRASHLKLSIETLMGTVMKLLPNCSCVFLEKERHIRVKKGGTYYKLDVSRLDIT